jgi:hypothetical protein
VQRDFCSKFTDLETKTDRWLKNTNPFVELKAAVSKRHKLLIRLKRVAEDSKEKHSKKEVIEKFRLEAEMLSKK